jgi:hypothetical protein
MGRSIRSLSPATPCRVYVIPHAVALSVHEGARSSSADSPSTEARPVPAAGSQ